MTAWTLHTDPNGDPTLWHGDTAVIRPADLGPHVPHGYRQALFDLLAAVLVQDEETVDRVARVLASFEYEAFSETVANAYRQRAREILDALAPDVPPPGPSPALAWTPPDVSVAQAAVTADAMDRAHDAVLGQEDGDE